METLFTNITSVITNIMSTMGTVSSELLKNEIFQIVIGVVFFNIVLGVIYSLIKKLRRRGK